MILGRARGCSRVSKKEQLARRRGWQEGVAGKEVRTLHMRRVPSDGLGLVLSDGLGLVLSDELGLVLSDGRSIIIERIQWQLQATTC